MLKNFLNLLELLAAAAHSAAPFIVPSSGESESNELLTSAAISIVIIEEIEVKVNFGTKLNFDGT